jgi:hypothetical protein
VLGYSAGGGELGHVPLPVAKAERVDLEAAVPRDGRRGGGIHPAAEQSDGAW